MTDFNTLGLAEPILRAVSSEGYTTPTEIQQAAIPTIMSGSDVLAIAQTGTGKTAAFVLPLLQRMITEKTQPPSRGCRALILAPTRELAVQIGECIRAYGKFMRPSYAVVVGGVSPGPQIRALQRGVDILVATPGRLLDHLGTGAAQLRETRTIVLDEADQMLDLGFMPAIRRIMGQVARERQAIMLSATMPRPIRQLANEFLRQPKEVAVAPAARPIERIDQRVMLVDSAAKRGVLVDVLRQPDVRRAIVFTRTKRGADKVSSYLDAAGLSAAAIHGNKSQGQRDRAMDSFRTGRIKILVATDIAARGIDVDGITHVVNFEIPHVPEIYVHRIGRTARAGAIGVSISLCDAGERGLMRDIERLIGRSLIAGGRTETAVVPAQSGEAPRPAHPPRHQSRAPHYRGPQNAPRHNGQRHGENSQRHGANGQRQGASGQRQGENGHRHGGGRHASRAGNGAAPQRRFPAVSDDKAGHADFVRMIGNGND